jgi:hypothetical protein
MRRALLLEPTGFDLNGCTAWGELHILFPAGMPHPAHSPEFSLLLTDRLEEIRYNSVDDAFIVAGKLSKVTRAIGILYSLSPILHCLYWDASRQRYAVVEC